MRIMELEQSCPEVFPVYMYAQLQVLVKCTGLVRLLEWKLGYSYKDDPSEVRQALIEKAYMFWRRTLNNQDYTIIPFELAEFRFKKAKELKNKWYSYELYDGKGQLRPNYKELIKNGFFKPKENEKKGVNLWQPIQKRY